jgi:hypothetical protein
MFWKIWFWTINPFALEGIGSVVVVESSKPKSTNVSGKGPLTNPNIIFDRFRVSKSFSVIVTVLADITVSWVVPCLVEVMIHDNV